MAELIVRSATDILIRAKDRREGFNIAFASCPGCLFFGNGTCSGMSPITEKAVINSPSPEMVAKLQKVAPCLG